MTKLPKNKLDKLIAYMNSRNIGFSIGKNGTIHLKTSEIPDDFLALIDANGGRLSNFYNVRMARRPSYIKNKPSPVDLNKADVVLFESRGPYDDQSMAFEQRYKEPDSLQVVAKAYTRRKPVRSYHRPTEEQLYNLEGAIRELPGYKVSNAMLKRLQDERFRDDVMNRLYWPLKNSGASEETNTLLDKARELYGIEFMPGKDPYRRK